MEGSSRVVGGTSRGRAPGNVFSHADGEDLIGASLKGPTGKVNIYKSIVDPAQTGPSMTFKTEVVPSLGPILTKFRRKYSPVRGKYKFNSNFQIFIMPS
jgi:hypothetical protein